MKKTLLGASALVGVASFAAAPALAAEAPEISFSGALGYEAVWSDGDQEAAGTGLNITGNEQQSELVWSATGTADNGLEYGANVQWRWLGAGAGAGGFDESYMDFRGASVASTWVPRTACPTSSPAPRATRSRSAPGARTATTPCVTSPFRAA